MITETDLKHLQRCVELAEMAIEEGDKPFGSVLVSAAGEVLFEDHNHVMSGDPTQHPEFAIAKWAATNLSPDERRKAIVYTSGEHCAMCSAAHGWAGLGRIVYATSSKQLGEWMKELGAEPSPIYSLAIEDVIKDAQVEGPVPALAEQMRALHVQSHAKLNK